MVVRPRARAVSAATWAGVRGGGEVGEGANLETRLGSQRDVG